MAYLPVHCLAFLFRRSEGDAWMQDACFSGICLWEIESASLSVRELDPLLLFI
jgi:hypothetical protein